MAKQEDSPETKTKEEIITEIKDCCALSDIQASEAYHIVQYWITKNLLNGEYDG